ncbi:hypothetical protein [Peribacillus simplex]|nr:hypothetical protein [Peribacillus simplex]
MNSVFENLYRSQKEYGMTKRNRTLLLMMLATALIWGIVYWLFIV